MTTLTETQRKRLAAAAILLFILFSAAIAWFIGRPLLHFVSEPEHFRLWVDSHGALGRLAFIGMMTLQVFIAVIPGEPLEIGAGYDFGAWEGTFLCLLGILIGSGLIFGFVRKFGVKAAEVFFPREKLDSLRFLQDTKRLTVLAFFLFLIPGTPKDLLSYCVGLTKMKLTTWLLLTGTARIPSVLTSTIGGDALGLGNHGFAIVVFAITALLSIIGLLVYRKICAGQKQVAPQEGKPSA